MRLKWEICPTQWWAALSTVGRVWAAVYEECLRKAAVPTLLIYLPTNHLQVHAGRGLVYLIAEVGVSILLWHLSKKSQSHIWTRTPTTSFTTTTLVVHQSTNLTTNQMLVRIDVELAVNSKVLRWTRGYPGENTAEGECRECKAVCLPPSLPPNSPSQPPLTHPPTHLHYLLQIPPIGMWFRGFLLP